MTKPLNKRDRLKSVLDKIQELAFKTADGFWVFSTEANRIYSERGSTKAVCEHLWYMQNHTDHMSYLLERALVILTKRNDE